MQSQQIITLISVTAIMFGVIGFIILMANYYTLNGIKRKTVGDGQHGTAMFATKGEINKTYKKVPFYTADWRKGNNLPDTQGTIVGMTSKAGIPYALVDDGDVHTLMVGAAGVGKTACFLYPNLEFACASGMSFITTDTKGDLARNYGMIAKDYGYKVAVIDLRNPTKSDSFNMLYLVNKYMDIYLQDKSLAAKARAERYAKITAKTIIYSGSMDASSFGQNAFFYDAAEGLLTAVILLIAEYCEHEKRHIISVFKMIQDLLAPSAVKGKNQFQLLIDRLPPTHKARWFAGAALNSAEQAMASVLSTALSRLNSFLDSEMEQILCFDTCVDAEKFCNEKSAIFLIMPEEDSSKYFMISLIVQQLYREILSVADEKGGKLDNRVMMYLDEIGTIPKIDSAEMMFSASRSRKISIVAIIQSLAQLEKNYGDGASIIIDNCQCTLFGGFAPNSETAVIMSKNLGEQTILSGSVTRTPKDGSQQLQMISRPLMTPDELKTMEKFHFIVAKTGCNPMKTVLKLFFDWGIKFGKEYSVTEQSEREVQYANKEDILLKLPKPPIKSSVESQPEGQSHTPPVQEQKPNKFSEQKRLEAIKHARQKAK